MTALFLNQAYATETFAVKTFEIVTERTPGSNAQTVTVNGFDDQNRLRVALQAYSTFIHSTGNTITSYSIGVPAVNGKEWFSTTLKKDEYKKLSEEVRATTDRAAKSSTPSKCSVNFELFHGAAVKSTALVCN